MAKSLLKQLKGSYNVIIKNLSNSNAWLRDNFYVIDKYYRELIAEKSALSEREIYKLADACCERNDYNLTPELLVSFFNAQSKSFGYFTRRYDRR